MRKNINYQAGRTPRITVDWTSKLEKDDAGKVEKIVKSGWTLDRNGGEMMAEEGFDEKTSWVRIQKGRPANQYALACHAVTDTGRKLLVEYWLNCNGQPAPEPPAPEPALEVVDETPPPKISKPGVK